MILKNIRTKIVVIVAMLLLASCKKDPVIGFDQFEFANEISKIGPYSVTIKGTYSFPTEIKGMVACVSEEGSPIGEYAVVLSGKEYSVEITGLRPSTKYDYYYSVDYGATNPGITKSNSFSTRSVTTMDDMPLVRIQETLVIDSVTCRVKCEVVDDRGYPVIERGVCWNTSGDPGLDDMIVQCDSAGLGVFIVYLEHLSLGRLYYVRAYAKNANGVGRSSVESFKMEALPGMPVNIQVSCSPEEGGMVTGGGTYEAGTTCTVEAVAAAGFSFVNWTENGNQVWSEEIYSFPVTVERNLVANFSAEAFIVSVGIEPEGSGTASGAGGYSYGDTCTLAASPAMGFEFVKWTRSENMVSTEIEYSFAVTGSETYTAHFQAKNYSVSVTANPEEGGSVSGGGTFTFGTSCTVHAVPAEGYAFEKWTDEGDVVSSVENFEFVVTSNRDLVAHFTALQPNEYSISVSANPSQGGSVTGGGVYQQGQSCTVRAMANANFGFEKWTENGETVSEDEEYTFIVTNNRTLVAYFTAQDPSDFTIIVEADPEAGGTVTGGGTYQQGQSCTLTATANPGYTFDHWTKDGANIPGNASITFSVTENATYVAHFTILTYTISTLVSPTGAGSVTGGGTYTYGQSCTLTATANTGYTFDHWTKDGANIPGNASITFPVTENATYVAHFTILTYTISTSVIPTGAGSVTGGGTYTFGQSCTLTATANPGYTYDHWTRNGINIGGGATITFTVTENATYVAHFNVLQAPVGAINGLFTINDDDDQVWFSQGNLQFNAALGSHVVATGGTEQGTWRFSENQWDYIGGTNNSGGFYGNVSGSSNNNISPTYDGWIDLFGWGTSGWNNGNLFYHPWDYESTGTSTNGYGYGPTNGISYTYNLTGQYSNADWGVYNSISNGGNQSMLWRILTKNEWSFLFNERVTNSGILYARACVNSTNGVILLPDDWDSDYYTLYSFNESNADFSNNTISSNQWNTLEQHGAIFLPAACHRSGVLVWDDFSSYWSSTASSMGALSININALNNYNDTNRSIGLPIRLVRDAE